MTDPVDEFAVEAIGEYEGHRFHSISRGDLDLEDDAFKEEKKKNEELAKDNEGLLKDMKEFLGDKVADVRLSNRLKSGAVCLVADAARPVAGHGTGLCRCQQPHAQGPPHPGNQPAA